MTPCGKLVPRRFAGTRIEAVSACARGGHQMPSICLQAGGVGALHASIYCRRARPALDHVQLLVAIS